MAVTFIFITGQQSKMDLYDFLLLLFPYFSYPQLAIWLIGVLCPVEFLTLRVSQRHTLPGAVSTTDRLLSGGWCHVWGSMILCCWSICPSAAATPRWASAEKVYVAEPLPNSPLPLWPLCSWAHWASTGMTGKQRVISSTWIPKVSSAMDALLRSLSTFLFPNLSPNFQLCSFHVMTLQPNDQQFPTTRCRPILLAISQASQNGH